MTEPQKDQPYVGPQKDPADRLAAALSKVLFYPVVGIDGLMTYEEVSRAVIAADRNVVCPNPDDHPEDPEMETGANGQIWTDQL